MPFLATVATIALLAATVIGLSRLQSAPPKPKAADPDTHLAGDQFHWDRATWDALTSLGF